MLNSADHKKQTSSTFIKSGLCACLFLLTVFVCLSTISPPAEAAVNKKYASLVMDADTGMILSERYADKSLHPASLTKIMTLIMAFDALEKGTLRLRDRIYISRHAASMVPSKLGLKPGSSIRVEDAIYALTTKSANDIAVALAEKLGGSESHFAVMMNRKARQIGMTRTHFRNASGLHHPRQVSTARDMAKLASYTLRRYPNYYHYFSTRKFTYRGKTYRNHNRLLDTYHGMDGFKTGYINASGFNLVASAQRGNTRLIGVVFGGRSSRTRNAHMAKILDRGFSRMNEILVASAAPLSTPVPARKPATLVTLASSNIPLGRDLLKKTAIKAKRFADLNGLYQDEDFSAILGQGDIDPAAARRLETGMLAVAAVRNQLSPVATATDDRAARRISRDNSLQTAAFTPYKKQDWAIQIGAFHSRVKTDQAIARAYTALPAGLREQAVATIVPLRTHQGWLFRGRLNGFTKQTAEAACRYLRDCLPVSPTAY